MSISKIQTGDKVKITAGKFKGTLGQVIKVIKKIKGNGKRVTRAVVSGVPGIVKYRKGQKFANVAGEMGLVNRTMDISNITLVDKDGKASKSKIENKDGKHHRVFKTTGEKVQKQEMLDETKKDSKTNTVKKATKAKKVVKKKTKKEEK